MKDAPIYEERLSSNKTEALFIGLTILFLILLLWQVSTDGSGILIVAFFIFFIFFFFYSVNYRTLIIRLYPHTLKLKFGVFSWTIPLDNMQECSHDDLPVLMKYGGAGIHFMLIRRRYRASFNFLEHPRVVIALKKKSGLVRDVSFSTRHPDEVIQLLQNIASA